MYCSTLVALLLVGEGLLVGLMDGAIVGLNELLLLLGVLVLVLLLGLVLGVLLVLSVPDVTIVDKCRGHDASKMRARTSLPSTFVSVHG